MSYRKRPEVVEVEIEATRRRIEAGLGQLNNSTNPANLFSSVLGGDSGAPIQDFSALAEKARQNPIPTALIGLGLVGLLLADRGHSSTPQSNRPVAPDPDVHEFTEGMTSAERVAHQTGVLKAEAGAAARSAKTGAKEVASSARETAVEATAKTRDALSSASGAVSEGIRNAAASLGDAGETISDAAKAAPREVRVRGNQLIEWVQENPLTAGLVALAAGAGVASVLAGRNTSPPANRLRASQKLHEMARADDYFHPIDEGLDTMPGPVPVTRSEAPAKSSRNGTVRNAPARKKTGAGSRAAASVKSPDDGNAGSKLAKTKKGRKTDV